MYSVEFDYWLNTVDKYRIVAKCKNVVGYDVIGFSFTVYNDADEIIRLRYDKEVFDEIEQQGNEELLEEYFNPSSYCGAH